MAAKRASYFPCRAIGVGICLTREMAYARRFAHSGEGDKAPDQCIAIIDVHVLF